MLWIIDRITKVKVEEGVEESGLDLGLHGESAYTDAI
jgi:ammonia channel protein AmtB